MDTITVAILPDGSIKTEAAGQISGANHSAAEALFRGIAELAGGPHRRERSTQAHSHTHTHAPAQAKAEA